MRTVIMSVLFPIVTRARHMVETQLVLTYELINSRILPGGLPWWRSG